MERILAALVVALTTSQGLFADEAPRRFEFTYGADAGFVAASGYPSWTDGSVGKLR